MERLIISADVEKALNIWKEREIGLEEFINCTARGKWSNGFKPLNDVSISDFSLLLHGWYEVEKPFKVGDWAKRFDRDTYIKVTNNEFNNELGFYEKVTEPWKIMLLDEGREKPEFKHNDVIIVKSGLALYFNEANNQDSFIEILNGGKVEKFFPAERGIDMKVKNC